MTNCHLPCDLHDYIEIACLYGYQLRLTLKDHQVVEGRAMNIYTHQSREYLVINQKQSEAIELSR